MASTEEYHPTTQGDLAEASARQEAVTIIMPTFTEALDEPATRRDLASLTNQINANFNQINARFVTIDARFVTVDARFVEIKEILVEIKDGFAEINTRFAEINTRFAEINTRFADMDTRFADMDTRFAGLTEKRSRDVWAFTTAVAVILISIFASNFIGT